MSLIYESWRIIYTQSGQPPAEITYQAPDAHGVIIASHTFVAPSLRGQGIATLLVDALAEQARANGWKIYAQCSYVVSLFRRHPAKYADVIAHE